MLTAGAISGLSSFQSIFLRPSAVADSRAGNDLTFKQ